MVDFTERDLEALHDTHNQLKLMKSWLYGENGYEGDIPDIKACIKDHAKRIRRIELIIVGLLVLSGLGGGIFSLVNLLT